MVKGVETKVHTITMNAFPLKNRPYRLEMNPTANALSNCIIIHFSDKGETSIIPNGCADVILVRKLETHEVVRDPSHA